MQIINRLLLIAVFTMDAVLTGCSQPSKDVIDKISDGSCLFIWADDKYYKENSIFSKLPQ